MPRDAATEPDVEMIQRDRADVDESLPRPGHRLGDFRKFEFVDVAMVTDQDRFHDGDHSSRGFAGAAR